MSRIMQGAVRAPFLRYWTEASAEDKLWTRRKGIRLALNMLSKKIGSQAMRQGGSVKDYVQAAWSTLLLNIGGEKMAVNHGNAGNVVPREK